MLSEFLEAGVFLAAAFSLCHRLVDGEVFTGTVKAGLVLKPEIIAAIAASSLVVVVVLIILVVCMLQKKNRKTMDSGKLWRDRITTNPCVILSFRISGPRAPAARAFQYIP